MLHEIARHEARTRWLAHMRLHDARCVHQACIMRQQAWADIRVRPLYVYNQPLKIISL